ncbi:MAG: hypothetical protein KAS04_04120 [Candidatus Aenigmarchaeota archaeon]|nr:hypothetical protein [Candidatus Aenigmarchaeota archaeon]
MSKGIDIGEYISKISKCMEELYSDKLDLSKYEFKDLAMQSYSAVIDGVKNNKRELIDNGFINLYQVTDARIGKTGINKYGNDSRERQLFDIIHNTIGEMYKMMDIDLESFITEMAKKAHIE